MRFAWQARGRRRGCKEKLLPSPHKGSLCAEGIEPKKSQCKQRWLIEGPFGDSWLVWEDVGMNHVCRMRLSSKFA